MLLPGFHTEAACSWYQLCEVDQSVRDGQFLRTPPFRRLQIMWRQMEMICGTIYLLVTAHKLPSCCSGGYLITWLLLTFHCKNLTRHSYYPRFTDPYYTVIYSQWIMCSMHHTTIDKFLECNKLDSLLWHLQFQSVSYNWHTVQFEQ